MYFLSFIVNCIICNGSKLQPEKKAPKWKYYNLKSRREIQKAEGGGCFPMIIWRTPPPPRPWLTYPSEISRLYLKYANDEVFGNLDLKFVHNLAFFSRSTLIWKIKVRVGLQLYIIEKYNEIHNTINIFSGFGFFSISNSVSKSVNFPTVPIWLHHIVPTCKRVMWKVLLLRKLAKNSGSWGIGCEKMPIFPQIAS